MESIILSCKPNSSPSITETFPKYTPNPLKSPNVFNNTHISFPSKPDPRLIDLQLNYLCTKQRLKEAISVLDSVADTGYKVKPKTFTRLLQSCIDLDSIHLGRQLHQRIHLLKKVDDRFIQTKLVGMYAKCGSFEDARKVFDEITVRSLYTWSAMIGACSREARWREVVELFYLMMDDGVVPDWFLFSKILQACGNYGDVGTGRLIHSLVIRSGLSHEIRICNSILAVYAKGGRLECAQRLFDTMDVKSNVTWNSILMAYCQKGKVEDALKLFELMREKGIEPGLVTWNTPNPLKSPNVFNNTHISFPSKLYPRLIDLQLNYLCTKQRLKEAISVLDSVADTGYKVKPKTFTRLLQSCIDLDSIHLGRQLHQRIHLLKEVDDRFIQTKLVGMYAKCGSFEDARRVFDEITVRSLYTWSAMIGACSREARWREAVELFYLMMDDGVVPDWFLFPKILQACGNCGDVGTGRLIHSLVIRSGLSHEIRICNSILAVYAKGGRLECAQRLFGTMDVKCIVSWTSILTAYCQKGKVEDARKLFELMREKGIEPGLVTWNILITGYMRLGKCDVAMEMVREMESLGLTLDVYTWTTMISGCAQNNRTMKALNLFWKMVMEGVRPTGVTLTSALFACATIQDLTRGVELHCVAVKEGLHDSVLVGNSLINMYSKCGDLDAARRVFDTVRDKDSRTWNSMIGGYCHAGYCGKAHDLFMKMQTSDVLPNVITWNAMITGYMLNGDDDEAMYLFHKMEESGIIKRDTASWNSFIAGYVQRGLKDKALAFFRKMQFNSIEPNPVTILSILPACSNLVAAKKVKEIHGCVIRRNLQSELFVANSLMDAYAKSASILYSKAIFHEIPVKDTVSWNTLISGFVLHGCSNSALDLFDRMRKEGFEPDRSTFLGVISAYALAKLVDEGEKAFYCMTDEYNYFARLEHCAAMIDLYGRSGKLKAATTFISCMKIQPDVPVWTALLTASRIHGNARLAIYAGKKLLELEPHNKFFREVVSQAYVQLGFSEDSLKVKDMYKKNETDIQVGQCLIEVRNSVHSFVNGDRCEGYTEDLYSWINTRAKNPNGTHSYKGLCIEEEEKEETGGVHSEKLALAYALIGSPHISQPIRIVKNLRMCVDCHRTIKFISKTYGCEIYLKDSGSLHHFSDGNCSCDDYW